MANIHETLEDGMNSVTNEGHCPKCGKGNLAKFLLDDVVDTLPAIYIVEVVCTCGYSAEFSYYDYPMSPR